MLWSLLNNWPNCCKSTWISNGFVMARWLTQLSLISWYSANSISKFVIFDQIIFIANQNFDELSRYNLFLTTNEFFAHLERLENYLLFYWYPFWLYFIVSYLSFYSIDKCIYYYVSCALWYALYTFLTLFYYAHCSRFRSNE